MHSITFKEKYCPFTSASFRKNDDSEDSPQPGTSKHNHPAAIFQLPGVSAVSAHFFQSITETPPAWDRLADAVPALLQRPFLQAMEEAPPTGMEFHYLIFYHHGRAVGLAYFQRLPFLPDRSVRLPATSSVPTRRNRIKNWAARQFRHTLLIAGNALLTGGHASCFRPEVPVADRPKILEKAAWQLATHLRRAGKQLDVIVHKDIPAGQLPALRNWRQSGYHAFRFQPNMTIELRPEWRVFDDYLNAMNSKYRVRARRAVKKGQSLQRRSLTLEEIDQYSEQIYTLYRSIADQSGFNLVQLHPDFFYRMKQKLGDRYTLLAYFQKEDLVGFCTLLHLNDQAEAHFLGFKETVNRSAQLYLNMLYDLIRLGIDTDKTQIGFARTAMEIKSSVGAEPEDLYVLARTYRPLPNRLLPLAVHSFAEPTEWIQRRPFRRLAN